MSKVHKLKCEEPHFTDVVEGRKLFEVRFNDRGFEVGDFLDLTSLESSRQIRVEVIHMLRGGVSGAYGVKPRYVIMSVKLTEKEEA